jgi:predicted DCC family thiol-disulfide oxidoreductase YuxK
VKNLSNIVFLRKGDIKIKSKAALFICWDIGGILRLATLLFIVPTFILDFFYDVIAKYRYQWFGKKESCRIPTQEEKEKFLTDS